MAKSKKTTAPQSSAKTEQELQAENARLRKALDDAKSSGVISRPVDGTFKIITETPDGKEVEREYGFKSGCIRVAVPGGAQVSSEALMRIANGGEATAEEKQQFLALNNITQEAAQSHLAHLASIGAAFLEER